MLKKKHPELTIINVSNEAILDARIEYLSAKKTIEIGSLEPDDEFKHSIENQTAEDAIKLVFTDSSGNEHEVIVVGYVMKGMHSVVAKINKRAEGKWIVENQ